MSELNLDFYKDDIARAVSFLRTQNITQAQIYIENSREFIVAFFACLALDLRPLILSSNAPENELFMIDSLDKISSDKKEKINLNLNAKFYLKTSGSSGKPKIVEKSLDKMIKEAKFLASEFKFGDEFLASVSHQHMFGLTFKIFLPLILNAKIDPKFLNYVEILSEKELENRTLITSPTTIKALLFSPKKYKLSKLKNIICAGGKLSDDLKNELLSLAPFINIYGSTETGIIACDLGDKLNSFKVVKTSLDKNGCLVVSSPWCDEFITGDIAIINGQNLKLLGRFDRIVKINEKRISLDSLEEAIKAHEFIDDCACLSVQNLGRIVSLIVLSKKGKIKFKDAGKKAIISELKFFLQKEYQNNVKHFKIVREIAKNAQGKFSKDDFLKLFNKREGLKFKLIKKDKNSAKFSADIDCELFYFDGHFIDFPILPGFIQLESVINLAFNLGLDLTKTKKIEAIKFSGFLRPGDKAIFELEIKNNKLYFSVKNDRDKICAMGRICIN